MIIYYSKERNLKYKSLIILILLENIMINKI